MTIWILRAFFVAASVGAGASLMWSKSFPFLNNIWTIPVVMLFSIVIIGADVAFKKKRIDLISSVYFGTIVGLFLTYVLSLALTPFFEGNMNDQEMIEDIQSLVTAFMGIALCYLCISLLWQTKDDFRFIIPYVEFCQGNQG